MRSIGNSLAIRRPPDRPIISGRESFVSFLQLCQSCGICWCVPCAIDTPPTPGFIAIKSCTNRRRGWNWSHGYLCQLAWFHSKSSVLSNLSVSCMISHFGEHGAYALTARFMSNESARVFSRTLYFLSSFRSIFGILGCVYSPQNIAQWTIFNYYLPL